ncbi:MAG TPA: hypothetical protein VD865_03815 [Stenotrophomonas sp.]|nr:hypothetical protein [Stenotrophomonas sp.]
MRHRVAPLDTDTCWHQCEQLGVARVRALLRQEQAEPRPGWRSEAQRWLDERLRREGEYAYRGVLAAITVLSALIACMVWWRW